MERPYEPVVRTTTNTAYSSRELLTPYYGPQTGEYVRTAADTCRSACDARGRARNEIESTPPSGKRWVLFTSSRARFYDATAADIVAEAATDADDDEGNAVIDKLESSRRTLNRKP